MKFQALEFSTALKTLKILIKLEALKFSIKLNALKILINFLKDFQASSNFPTKPHRKNHQKDTCLIYHA